MDNNELRLRIACRLWTVERVYAAGENPRRGDRGLARVKHGEEHLISVFPVNETDDEIIRAVINAERVTCPDWPNDIAAAWVLLEDMQSKTKATVRVVMPGTYGRVKSMPRYIAVIEGGDLSYDTPNLTRSEGGDTAPEAICKAWLAVMEPQEEQG